MAASVAVGPTTSVIGSEVQLGSTITASGNFVIYIDLINLAAGEILEVRIYDKVPGASGTERLAQGPANYGPIVPEEKIVASIPVISVGWYRVTIKQLFGTVRSFPWEIRSA
jgi:hypothetical protein